MPYVSENQTKYHEFTATAYSQPAEPASAVSLTLSPNITYFWRPQYQLSGGSPAGGTYSGHGVLDPSGIFDPKVGWTAGGAPSTATLAITITYTAPSGSTATDTMTIRFPILLPPNGGFDPLPFGDNFLNIKFPELETGTVVPLGMTNPPNQEEFVEMGVIPLLSVMVTPPNYAAYQNPVNNDGAFIVIAPSPPGVFDGMEADMLFFCWDDGSYPPAGPGGMFGGDWESLFTANGVVQLDGPGTGYDLSTMIYYMWTPGGGPGGADTWMRAFPR